MAIALIQFFEMSTRLARGFSLLEDRGQARLYLSKASEFREEIDEIEVISPAIDDQMGSSLCTFHLENIRDTLREEDGADLRVEHVTQQALSSIKKAYLPLVHLIILLLFNSK